MAAFELRYYQTAAGKQPFTEWLNGLKDLLCGGDKTARQKDIERAKELFEDYKVRSAKKPKPRRGA